MDLLPENCDKNPFTEILRLGTFLWVTEWLEAIKMRYGVEAQTSVINKADNAGFTPLMAAVESKSFASVRVGIPSFFFPSFLLIIAHPLFTAFGKFQGVRFTRGNA